jgi:cytochrome c
MKKILISSFAVAVVALMGMASAPAYADVEKGAKVFKKCKACHTVESGGKNGLGPNLFNIVGRPAAAIDGFKYSDAMTEAAAGGLVWDEANLDEFLKKPKKFIKKTKMSFGGIKKDGKRADLIEYLGTLK